MFFRRKQELKKENIGETTAEKDYLTVDVAFNNLYKEIVNNGDNAKVDMVAYKESKEFVELLYDKLNIFVLEFLSMYTAICPKLKIEFFATKPELGDLVLKCEEGNGKSRVLTLDVNGNVTNDVRYEDLLNKEEFVMQPL